MTNPTDWRALCAELVEAVDDHVIDTNDGPRFYAVVDRARAALAQPGAEGVADEEICSFITRVWPHAPGNVHDSEWRADMLTMIRAAIEELSLTRWARPAIQPVPVTERLPGAGGLRCGGPVLALEDRRHRGVLGAGYTPKQNP